MIVEIILQYYGWEQGWSILSKIGGNTGEYTERSGFVAPLVGQGEYGIAPIIDFYGFAQVAALGPVKVDFFYPPSGAEVKHTVINPDSAGILKSAPHPETAKLFMEFILGYKGQKMLFKDPINRLPIRQDVYAESPAGYFNPFETTMTLMTYNDTLSTLRWDVVNSLYDTQLVIRRAELSGAWFTLASANTTTVDAKAKGYDVSEARSILLNAEAALTRMPVTEAWAKEFGEKFHVDATFRGDQIKAWDDFAVAKYSESNQLSNEASLTVISFVIDRLKAEAQQNLYYGLIGGLSVGVILGVGVAYVILRRRQE